MNGSFLRTIQLGLKGLAVQKMRASLAALGIFIGTTTVIWLVAMGEGVSYRAQQQILELGARNIIVRTKKPTGSSDGDASSQVRRFGLTRADFRRITSNIPSIETSVPMRELQFQLRNNNLTTASKLVGCMEEYLALHQLEIARGRWLTQRDRGQKVVVLGHETTPTLFPSMVPL